MTISVAVESTLSAELCIMNSISLLFVLFTAAEVKSVCYSASYYATTSLKFLRYYSYSNNDDCLLSIIPSSLYRSGYYLELKWTTFDIEGSLPTCTDYVEVFITSQRKSIGKYCSGNLGTGMLFNMYSSDGYATIRFRSDHSITKGGFRFAFQLKSIRSGYIGTYGSRLCYHTDASSYYGNFYSSGWPRGYTSGTCYFTITVPTGKAVRIAVLNLNLRSASISCNNAYDNFQIRGSNTLYGSLDLIRAFASSVSVMHCGSFHPGIFTTRYKYVYLIVNKPYGSYPHYSNSGFMMGYLIYDSSEVASTTLSTTTAKDTSSFTSISTTKGKDTSTKSWGNGHNTGSTSGPSAVVTSILIQIAIGCMCLQS